MKSLKKQDYPPVQKEKIRSRYQGVDLDTLDIIPAIPAENFYEDKSEKRVAVYVRVSTDDPRQTSSYELQKNHYQDVIYRHPGWNLAGIYADEGISGTSLLHRDAFVQMIEDCHHGKIDLIITKSVSRFARNILDCIGYVRKLASLSPPIGIFFETENFCTLDSKSEMNLAFISTLAQEESHNKSEIMNASIEMRFRRGIFLTPPLLGYDQNEEGNLVVNQEEAITVRLIFFMYLYGYTCREIADKLTELGRKTKQDRCVWSSSTVLSQLQNERHCGDILARKTWTPSYLDHKSKKNKKDRNQYLQKNHHPAIISRDDFIAVQHLIQNAKYGNKDILPRLQVITSGILKGFVIIHPSWSGFLAKDYLSAGENICEKSIPPPEKTYETEPEGLFFKNFEIVRGEFIQSMNRISVTFSPGFLRFSAASVRNVPTDFVELLIHPEKKLLAVRPSDKNKRTALRWSLPKREKYYPRIIRGAAFLPTLYNLLDWNPLYSHRILGSLKQKDKDVFLLFELSHTEIRIPAASLKEKTDSPFGKGEGTVDSKYHILYPENWSDNFGEKYFANQPLETSQVTEWKSNLTGIPFEKEPFLHTTPLEKLNLNIKKLIDKIQQEQNNE
jgi:DNA invertase Pin-like site-specific DNA recombinase